MYVVPVYFLTNNIDFDSKVVRIALIAHIHWSSKSSPGSLVRPKVVRSVHYCSATKKTLERKYTDMTSLDPFPSAAVYPTKDDEGNPLETEYGLSTFKDHQTFSIQVCFRLQRVMFFSNSSKFVQTVPQQRNKIQQSRVPYLHVVF